MARCMANPPCSRVYFLSISVCITTPIVSLDREVFIPSVCVPLVAADTAAHGVLLCRGGGDNRMENNVHIARPRHRL